MIKDFKCICSHQELKGENDHATKEARVNISTIYGNYWERLLNSANEHCFVRNEVTRSDTLHSQPPTKNIVATVLRTISGIE
jgi:hypothetical protein